VDSLCGHRCDHRRARGAVRARLSPVILVE
jgi:hypothetical protein